MQQRRQPITHEAAVSLLTELTDTYFKHLIDEICGIFKSYPVHSYHDNHIYQLVMKLKMAKTSLDVVNNIFGEESKHQWKSDFNGLVRVCCESVSGMGIVQDDPFNNTAILGKLKSVVSLKNILADPEKKADQKIKDFHACLIEKRKYNYPYLYDHDENKRGIRTDALISERRNLGTDFMAAALSIIFLPVAIGCSIYTKVNYGTWNFMITRGEKTMRSAHKIISDVDLKSDEGQIAAPAKKTMS